MILLESVDGALGIRRIFSHFEADNQLPDTK